MEEEIPVSVMADWEAKCGKGDEASRCMTASITKHNECMEDAGSDQTMVNMCNEQRANDDEECATAMEKMNKCFEAEFEKFKKKTGGETPEEQEGLAIGAIIGIIIAFLIIVGGGSFAIWWFKFREKPNSSFGRKRKSW